MTDRTAMTAPTDFTVLAASTAESSKVIGSVTPTGDAVRTLGLLAGGVGADRRADQHGAGVNADGAAVDGDREAVETTGGGATLLLADPVVLRAVALALEPLRGDALRSEEHTSELQSLMRISYAVFCLKKKKTINNKQEKQLNNQNHIHTVISQDNTNDKITSK